MILSPTPITLNDLESIPATLQTLCQGFDGYVLISDKNILPHHHQHLQTYLNALFPPSTPHLLYTVPAGEAAKTWDEAQRAIQWLSTQHVSKKTALLAFGGGSICDFVGFIGHIYLRGLPVVYLPTTVLCLIDAAIGGKTALNTDNGKNQIGTIRLPTAIIQHPHWLSTLSNQALLSGLAEMTKHALIADKAFYQTLIDTPLHHAQDLSQWWPLCLQAQSIKAQVVSRDLEESNYRHILNFGHTIAHALEKVSDYTLPHGHAVGIGLAVESALSAHLNHLDLTTAKAIQAHLYQIPWPWQSVLSNISAEQLIDPLAHDKKNHHQQYLTVCLKDIGVVAACSDRQYTQPVSLEALLIAYRTVQHDWHALS